MKFKFLILVVSSFLFVIACKNDINQSEKTSVNSSESVKTEVKDSVTVRKVSIGLIPDIQYTGAGVKAQFINPGQEAEKTGLKAGDIVVAIDGKEIKTLSEYTEYMDAFKIGDSVEMTIKRGNQTLKKKLTFE